MVLDPNGEVGDRLVTVAAPRLRYGQLRVVSTMAVIGFLLGSCGVSSDPSDRVRVSAASSLSDVFAELESAFEAANPGVDVILNLGGSSLLREQILAGAPVDVYASASADTMAPIVAAGLAEGEPTVFARGLLEIAVPVGNPAHVTGLDDFGNEELFIGLCDQPVPCGDLARQVLARAGVDPVVDTGAPNVRALLTKIEAGELDAGIVYVTDVRSVSGRVEGIAIPDALNVAVDYPIAVLAEGPNRDDARSFVDFVLSEIGQTILAGHGFVTP